jgi:transposase
VRPETVLRWHRDLLARRHAAISRRKRTGRQPTVRSTRALVLRLARENSSWRYRRIHGELLTLGIKVAASTVWEILKDAGFDPAPERTTESWASLLRSQAEAILAADFLETVTLTGVGGRDRHALHISVRDLAQPKGVKPENFSQVSTAVRLAISGLLPRPRP